MTDSNVLPINGSDNGSIYNTSTSTVTPGQMTGQTPITTVNTPADTTNYPAIINGITQQTQAQQDAATTQAQVDAENNTQAGLASNIVSLMGQENNKAADTQNAQDTAFQNLGYAGTADANKRLSDINSQIQNEALNANSAITSLPNGGGFGMGGTSSYLSSEENKITRESAIRTNNLSAQYNILKGNYDTALKNATDAVNLKYAPIENQIKTLQQQYDFNKDALTAADKKAATALQASITEKANAVADAKQTEQNNVSTANTYIKLAGDAGQMQIASEIQKLDPASPTFRNDLAALVTQIKPKADTTGTPNSYKEWSLAGGKAGTGQTYAYEEKRVVLSNTATTVVFTTPLTFKHYIWEIAKVSTAKTSADYDLAIQAMLEDESKMVVVCEDNSDTTAAKLEQMCVDSRDHYNTPCVYFRSAEATDTATTIIAKAEAHNSDRVILSYPMLVDFNGKTLSSWECASSLAGAISGNWVPKLNHNFTAFESVWGVSSKISDMDALLSSGVTPIELKYNSIHIVRLLTTKTTTNSVPDTKLQEWAVRLNVDFIEKAVSKILQEKFLQQGNTSQVRLAMKAEVVSSLTKFTAMDILVADPTTNTPAFRDPVVSTDPADATKVNVDVEIAPGKPLNFISLNFKVYL